MGAGIFPGFYEHCPRLLPQKNRRKTEAKEFLNCLIPQLLVVITQKLEILVTARTTVKPVLGSHSWGNDQSTPIKPQYQKTNSPN